ncbi:hypothetical protein BGX38DRAFT_764209, partial [Terfezia claveryi]
PLTTDSSSPSPPTSPPKPSRVSASPNIRILRFRSLPHQHGLLPNVHPLELLPAPMLHAIGIHYYPSRWWSLALPSWLVVAVGWIYVALAGYNTGYLTPDLNAVEEW